MPPSPSLTPPVPRYEDMQLPDAYERLIIDALNGDKRLFIRNDELDAAWQVTEGGGWSDG